MKRKTLTLAISVFALLAIISVGFASWVITKTVTPAEKSGTFTVETVEEYGVTIDAVWVDKDGVELGKDPAIVFGNKTENKEQWLYSPTIGLQNLSAYLKITVTVTNASALEGKKVETRFSVNEENLSKYNDALANYITGPSNNSTYNEGEFLGTAFSASTLTITKTVEFNFGWGAAFGNVHPIDKWQSYSSENATAAQTALDALHNDLNGIRYNVKVSVVNAVTA